jgi:hypothetical protein
VASLKRWNQIHGSAIQVGQSLTIFTGQSMATN